MPNPAPIPGMVSVKATEISPPPDWALMQRKLIATMEKAALLAHKNYTRPGGLPYYDLDVDDVYESRSMRGIFYAVGADDVVLDIALKEWNAITRYYDDGVVPPKDESRHPMYMAQLHNEFWNLAIPYNSDGFHVGEGSQFFYDFGVACPTNAEMYERARRFANLYIGEVPDAPNYDSEHKIIRSPWHGSEGPFLGDNFRDHVLIHVGGETTGILELVREMLDRRSMGNFSHRMGLGDKPSDLPLVTTLYPVVKELEPRWFEKPDRREEIIGLFEDIALNGDEPVNLIFTALVTNAYLYTGDDKYKNWVLEYVDAWMDRLQENNGIMPDNVGPTGVIGEKRQGQWWGGLHGWNSDTSGGADKLFIGCTIAAECALLLTGDQKYLDIIRSQIKLLLSMGKKNENGQLQVPVRHGPDGWEEYATMRMREMAHVYHGSFSDEDRDLIVQMREGDVERDWNQMEPQGDRRTGDSEFPRFQYYDGKNPDWPLQVLTAEYEIVMQTYEAMLNDSRTVEKIIEDNNWPPNPVVVKGLVEVTMGTPQTIYNGGLLRATVRYFDQDERRPGLPADVAALVDSLGPDHAGVHLVNTSPTDPRRLVVQAGAFGEHQFTGVTYNEMSLDYEGPNPGLRIRAARSLEEKSVVLDSKYLTVELPPMSSIQLQLGMRRFANNPSYAFPWHGGRVPKE